MSTTTVTPEQVAKLPKWAQEYIAHKERIAQRCETRLRELIDNTTPTDCWIKEHTLEFGKTFYLPSDRISFALGDGCVLDVHICNSRLVVMEHGAKHGSLDVKPQSSNVVSIGVS